MGDFTPILMDGGALHTMMSDARLSNSFGAKVCGSPVLRQEYPMLASLHERAVEGDRETKRLISRMLSTKILF